MFLSLLRKDILDSPKDSQPEGLRESSPGVAAKRRPSEKRRDGIRTLERVPDEFCDPFRVSHYGSRVPGGIVPIKRDSTPGYSLAALRADRVYNEHRWLMSEEWQYPLRERVPFHEVIVRKSTLEIN